MADVLRLVDRFGGPAGYPAWRDYIARATARTRGHTQARWRISLRQTARRVRRSRNLPTRASEEDGGLRFANQPLRAAPVSAASLGTKSRETTAASDLEAI